MAAATVHLPDVMGRVTLSVHVTGKRRLAVRLWIGARVLWLACVIMGCNVEMADDTTA